MGVDGCVGVWVVMSVTDSAVSLSVSPINNNRRCSLISPRYLEASFVSRAYNASASNKH